MISLITASRRPKMFFNLIDSLEKQIGDLIDNYICFVNNSNLIAEYKNTFHKIKIISAPHNYIFQNGFDSVYNLLQKANKSKYNLILFDCDIVTIDKEKFIEDLNKDADVYAFKMYMARGDALETKYQLYKNDNLLEWKGVVHENQQWKRQPKVLEITSLSVEHQNAIDNFSKNMKKDANGMIILEKVDENSDSFERNMLYESLAYRIVNENLYHQNRHWFDAHYKLNKEVIDWYYGKALERYLK